MKYLKNYGSFKPVNEDKNTRAEKNLNKAEEINQEIEDALAQGDTEKAEKLLNRSIKKIQRAKKLNPTIDITDIETKMDVLSKDIIGDESTTGNVLDNSTSGESTDEFDINTRDFRDKIKLKNFKFINKIKKIGDEISLEELHSFLGAVKSYINEYWDYLDNGSDFPKNYISPYNDFEIQVRKNLIGDIVFFYKEGGNDKLKLKLSKKDFDDKANKDIIIKEINDVLDSKKVSDEVKKDYDIEKDDKIATSTNKSEVDFQLPPLETQKMTTNTITALTKKDDAFVSETVKMLIDAKLNISYENTDETALYDYFIKNSKKFVVKENVDDILIKYRQKKSTLKESTWWDDSVSSFNRATQSMSTRKSNGVVGDLLWAFNSDAKKVSNDMQKIINRLASSYQKELNMSIEDLGKKYQVKENLGIGEFLSGALLSGLALKKMPKLASMVGIGGGSSTSTVARGGLSGVSKMGRLLTNPYTWLAIAIIAGGYGAMNTFSSFDEQQYQIAIMLIMMYSSGSSELNKEFKINGIKVTMPNIKMDSLNYLIQSGELLGSSDDKVSENMKYGADTAIENLLYEVMGDDFLDNRDDILDNVYTTLSCRTVNLAYESLCGNYPELLNYKKEFYDAAEKEGYFIMNSDKWESGTFESSNIKKFNEYKNKKGR